MKFALLVLIVAQDLEERAIDIARDAGAGGVTLLDARGIGSQQRKSFFGLTYEGSQTIMLCVLERKLSLHVMKTLTQELELSRHSRGVVFTVPLDHIAGIDVGQIEQFEERIKGDL